jgi:hypothetical protein
VNRREKEKSLNFTIMTDQFDFESFKQAAIKGLYEGKPLTGENGLFAPLLKHFLESALEPGRRSEGNGWTPEPDSPD